MSDELTEAECELSHIRRHLAAADKRCRNYQDGFAKGSDLWLMLESIRCDLIEAVVGVLKDEHALDQTPEAS